MRLHAWTCESYPDLTKDDRVLLDVLRSRGHEVHVTRWDDPTQTHAGFDGGVIRSTWDYHQCPEAFATWLRGMQERGTPLVNSAATALKNMDKNYLADLGSRGIPVIHTVSLSRGGDWSALNRALPGSKWVFKPTVSANAEGLWVAALPLSAEHESRLRNMLSDGDVLAQPFVQEVVEHGEWSFIFLDNVYSHAVLKRPAEGDFRVQFEFGGTVLTDPPPAALVEQAKEIYRRAGVTTCQARVDAVERDGRLELMELELIEPYLFLAEGENAAERFADAIEKHLTASQNYRHVG